MRLIPLDYSIFLVLKLLNRPLRCPLEIKKALKVNAIKTFIFKPVTRPGFEPRQAESESAVLPLYYRALKMQI